MPRGCVRKLYLSIVWRKKRTRTCAKRKWPSHYLHHHHHHHHHHWTWQIRKQNLFCSNIFVSLTKWLTNIWVSNVQTLADGLLAEVSMANKQVVAGTRQQTEKDLQESDTLTMEDHLVTTDTLTHSSNNINNNITRCHFINILCSPFMYESALHTFSLVTVWLCSFLLQEIGAKAACKMLMKLMTVVTSKASQCDVSRQPRVSRSHWTLPDVRRCLLERLALRLRLRRCHGHQGQSWPPASRSAEKLVEKWLLGNPDDPWTKSQVIPTLHSAHLQVELRPRGPQPCGLPPSQRRLARGRHCPLLPGVSTPRLLLCQPHGLSPLCASPGKSSAR